LGTGNEGEVAARKAPSGFVSPHWGPRAPPPDPPHPGLGKRL